MLLCCAALLDEEDPPLCGIQSIRIEREEESIRNRGGWREMWRGLFVTVIGERVRLYEESAKGE